MHIQSIGDSTVPGQKFVRASANFTQHHQRAHILNPIIIPPQRSALSEISGNEKNGPILSPSERDIIIGMLLGGCTTREAGTYFQRSQRCIQRI